MTVRNLPVICGPTTCYSFEDEKMCRFVRSKRMGTIWVCGLYFDKNGDSIVQKGQDTALERCDACLKELG